MQTTSLPSHLPPPPSSGHFTRRKRASPAPILAMRREERSGEKGHDRNLVDENMIVLRMRIREVVKKEREGRADSTRESRARMMEREEEWCENYESDVYELVGLLQNLAMETRPSLVVGMVVALVFCGSTSFVVVLAYLLSMVVGMLGF